MFFIDKKNCLIKKIDKKNIVNDQLTSHLRRNVFNPFYYFCVSPLVQVREQNV